LFKDLFSITVANNGKYLLTLIFAAILMTSVGMATGTAFGDKATATIPVGSSPVGVTFDPKNGEVYVTNAGSNTVSVIDSSTNTVTKTIPVGTDPVGVAFDSTHDKIYVTNENPNSQQGSISIIDTTTDIVTNTISDPSIKSPSAITFDSFNGNMYETNGLSTTISVINDTTNTVTNTIPIFAYPHDIAFDSKNGNIYETSGSDCSSQCIISVINGTTNTVIKNIGLSYATQSNPIGIAIDSDNGEVYVEGGGSIIVINGTTNSIINTISDPSSFKAPTGVTFDPNNGEIYVANQGSNTVSVINDKTNNVVNTVIVGSGPQFLAVNPVSNKIYVTNTNDNTVSVIDGNTPSPPTGLVATITSSSQADLSWKAPVIDGGSPITGYMIERSTDNGSTWSTRVTNTGSASTSYSDTGISQNIAYTYRVSAINSFETSSPSNTTIATAIVMNNIQSISGTVSSAPYQITLSNFNTSTANNRLLVVGVSANNNGVASITFGGAPLTRAVSSFNNNDAEFWYLTNPSGTGDIVVTMVNSTSAIVGAYSFSGVDQTTPISSSATNHNTVASSPSVSITASSPTNLVLDLPSISGVVTLYSPTCAEEWNINMPSTITGASSSTITSSAGLVTCSWTASRNGDFWDDVAIEVKASGFTSQSTSPGSPTGLASTATSPSQINLGWNSPSDNGGSAITGYKIERSTDGGTTWSSVVTNTGNTNTTYSDTGLTHSTTYTYRVSAINSVGTSSPSNTASSTTFNTVPSQPTGLKASAQLLQINLSWNAPSDNGGTPITGYMIERSTNNGSTWSTIVSNTGSTGTTYSDKNVLPLTTYTYRVSAINNIGVGNPSNMASASTLSAPVSGIPKLP